ncbi:hypothetical protein DFJ73DRAFT_640902 [Zopfochytrium polystomum]|nr:hypothetical protein DFJ73DRAFT_640902 [Zopfochytrium polystomum]
MSVGCIPYLIQYFQYGGNFAAMPLTNHPVSFVLSSYFVSYLWADLIVGCLFYRSSITFATGWLHHTGFTIAIAISIIFAVPGVGMLIGILEWPTLVLATGHIWRSLRSDYGFGVVFFVTRIIFLAFPIYHLSTSYPNKYLWTVLLLAYPLNIYWFASWVKQQVRLFKEKRAEQRVNHTELSTDAENGANVPEMASSGSVADQFARELSPQAPPSSGSKLSEPSDYKTALTDRDGSLSSLSRMLGDHLPLPAVRC